MLFRSSVILSRPFDELLKKNFENFENSFKKLKRKHNFFIKNKSKIDFENNIFEIQKCVEKIIK